MTRRPTSSLGQPDHDQLGSPTMLTAVDADGVETPVLCTTSNGKDANGNPTYPTCCNATLNFPRFALSAGRPSVHRRRRQRPCAGLQPDAHANGAFGGLCDRPDRRLGQPGVGRRGLAAHPDVLAWDGTNLYVSDAFNRRVTVYSVAPATVPYQGVRNAASIAIYARGSISIGGTITKGASLPSKSAPTRLLRPPRIRTARPPRPPAPIRSTPIRCRRTIRWRP